MFVRSLKKLPQGVTAMWHLQDEKSSVTVTVTFDHQTLNYSSGF